MLIVTESGGETYCAQQSLSRCPEGGQFKFQRKHSSRGYLVREGIFLYKILERIRTLDLWQKRGEYKQEDGSDY